MALPRLAPATYRKITFAALVALAVIVVTGALVRLTGSGLGCPDWPTCAEGQLVAPLEYHAMVEFVNRTVTGLVSLAVALAVLGSLLRTPRRRDLTWLSLGLVAGVAAQVVLGGLVVLFHLWPPLVMGHFLVSMLLIWCAVVLHHRAGQPAGPAQAVVAPELVTLGRLAVVGAAIVIVLGTVVTGTGPHAGSHDGELVERLPFSLPDVARLHGISVILFLALVVGLALLLRSAGAPRAVHRRVEVLLGVIVAQAVVGYTQYFLGVPAALVALHIAGALAVWIAVLHVALAMHVRRPAVGEEMGEAQEKPAAGDEVPTPPAPISPIP